MFGCEQVLFDAVAIVARRLPQPALHRFEQAFTHFEQGIGVVALEKGAGVSVFQIGIGDTCVLVVAYHACSGIEGEQVIDGSGHLERALVAMTLDAGNPLRVHHAGAHDAADLFL